MSLNLVDCTDSCLAASVSFNKNATITGQNRDLTCMAKDFHCMCAETNFMKAMFGHADCITKSCAALVQSQFVNAVSTTCHQHGNDISTLMQPTNPLRAFLPPSTAANTTTATPSSSSFASNSSSTAETSTALTTAFNSLSTTVTSPYSLPTGANSAIAGTKHLSLQAKGGIAAGVTIPALVALVILAYWLLTRKRAGSATTDEHVNGFEALPQGGAGLDQQHTLSQEPRFARQSDFMSELESPRDTLVAYSLDHRRSVPSQAHVEMPVTAPEGSKIPPDDDHIGLASPLSANDPASSRDEALRGELH
ncbi:hypothetical protein BDV96DRAFT_652544 [Lophiotrema nucula]|uniref:Uncharacterized protein n=1 Tax=Lophiotrema nucula TaxID=690887 RepID=A0A6A5YNS8_9PLEO|nr:hypothetical protein BDV96DRAFT_652544 [Lophiotrema nucula]